jgi:hypothetical protein
MAYFVEIQIPGLPSQEHELEDGPILVGSGPEAAIRLDESAGMASQHLQLLPGDDGVRVTVAPGVRAPLVFRGKPCTEALVPWGEEAYAGSVRLGFVLRARGSGSPVLLLLAPVLLLLAGMALIPEIDSGLEQGSEVDAPALAQAECQCREQEPARAALRAREAEHAGNAKLQRFPFVAREGLEAMDLLQEAAACYTLAQRTEDARRAHGAASAWSGQLGEDYAAARLRLRVALDRERHTDALAAVHHLQALLAVRPPSPYSEWLSTLERGLERQVAQSGP